MRMDIRKLKVGDICKYIANGVERYMIIRESYVDETTDINTAHALWSIVKGLKIEDLNHFTDFNNRDNVDYTKLDYIRIADNIYFPVNNILFITGNLAQDVVDYRSATADIEVIGHLSNTQLVFMEMYRIFSLNENYSHGRICDIETSDISDTEISLNKYIECYKIKRQWENDRTNRVPDPDHEAFNKATDADATMRNLRNLIPEWIEKYHHRFSYGIPERIPLKDIYNPDEDYDVKDIRDFEDGAIYQFLDYPIEKGGEIRYTFIKSNPTKNLSDDELERLCRNKSSIIVFACYAPLYHEEGMFREWAMFSMHHNDIFSDDDCGYFRIDDKFYIRNGDITNWVCRDREKFNEMLHAKRFKLVKKIDPVQMAVVDIASNYHLNGKLIDLDKINVDMIKPDVEEIKILEDKISSMKLSITRHQYNVINTLFGNTYGTGIDKSHNDVDDVVAKLD